MEAQFRAILIVLPALAFVGCTTPHMLRKNTIRQADTSMDLHQQQVLDNLARFVVDPHAVPSFAVATQGTGEITDFGQANAMLQWFAAGFNSATFGIGGSRQARGNWIMIPTTDPRRLELMRCAYQRCVSNCGAGGESAECPNCRKRWNQFYAGRSSSDANPSASLVSTPGSASGSGAVNSECLMPGCGVWFCIGCKHCVPKDCAYVGRYRDVCVWIPNGPGSDELAKLTLVVLDYAVNLPAQLPRKEVIAYLNKDREPTTEDHAAYVLRTELRLDEPSIAILKGDESKELLKTLRTQPLQFGETKDDSPEIIPEPEPVRTFQQFNYGTGILELDEQLRAVR
jgi:hypothetical protein